MFELVIANLRVRPLRTMISVAGVALGVILIVLFTGLARGMTQEMTKRAANWKAEIIFTRPGAMEPTSAATPLSTAYADRIREIEGVRSAIPVIKYITPSPKGRFGIQQLDGVDWEPFAAMNDMQLVAGRAPVANDEIVLDERQMRDDNVQIGDRLELFGGKSYSVVGVFSPPSGSRIKMSLAAMQEALETNKCTYILVKLEDGADAKAVAARIDSELPGNTVTLTSDWIIDAQNRVPGLATFLRILIGLGAFVSTIFVLLSMYTTVTERRKEIGILKSLGASKSYIIGAIESEALLIGVLGVIAGLVASFIASVGIGRAFELAFEFSPGWVAAAVLIAVAGSLIGALYPAWSASVIDPVEVMANE